MFKVSRFSPKSCITQNTAEIRPEQDNYDKWTQRSRRKRESDMQVMLDDV